MQTYFGEQGYRLVAAPMAGGPTTIALAQAVVKAGAFPFLAGGYQTAGELARDIVTLQKTVADFGVNLFVPQEQPFSEAELELYAAHLAADAALYDFELNTKVPNSNDDWEAKLRVLCDNPVPVVSLTFGLPAAADIARLQAVGTQVWMTVTTSAEAVAAAARGVDGLIVQGPKAGGHSATFDPQRAISEQETATVVGEVQQHCQLPLIAAGGVDGPEAVRALLHAGADAVAVGTILLRTDEAGTSRAHRQALASPAFTETVLTRVFTGRPARALRNDFIDQHEAVAPVAYPAVHYLTSPLRRAAAQAGDMQRLHLWAGTGWQAAPTGPAAEVIQWLAAGVKE